MAKLLLITSDSLLAKAYRARLTREGFDVEWQASGHEGLLKARRWVPELIAVDIALPGLHGLDVVKFLRDVPTLVQVPVVALIEHTLARETLEQCLLWGATSYLEKDRCSLDDVSDHLLAALLPRQAASSEPMGSPLVG